MTQYSIKAIIFDCDGTLVESEEAHLLAWKQVAEEHGFYQSYEEYLVFVGHTDMRVADFVAEKIKVVPANDLLVQKRAIFLESQKKGLPPITGTIAFLKKLIPVKDQFGLKLAVASAAYKPEIEANLRSLNIDHAFDVVLSGQEDLQDYNDPTGVNKPKPYIYQHAAKLLGVLPSECIAVEDSEVGVASGTSAGCFTIAIPNCHSKHQDFAKAHVVLETLEDYSVDRFLEMAKDHYLVRY